jgi:hypothetical protein
MRSIYRLEKIMNRKYIYIVTAIILPTLLLSACNLPDRVTAESTIPDTISVASLSTPTPVPSLCENLYFPNTPGDTWEYAGNTSATGAYTRTDSITNLGVDSLTVQSTVSGSSYNVDYSCTPAGLIAVNPIQQYLGPVLDALNGQVSLNLTSNSGITLPKSINPGDSWQQIIEWEGAAQGMSTNGRLVIDYTAAGYESVSVPSGTYDALKVNTSIRIEISNFRIEYGTYEITSWMAPNVGIIKSQGSSNVPNVQFSDSLELNQYSPTP